MIFSCTKRRLRIIVCAFVLVSFLSIPSYAQLILTPKRQTLAPIILNDYSYFYPDVPAEPVIRVHWYRTPNEISNLIELNNIEHDTKYFEDDDSPYLEKVIDGVKGRLFLKEVVGYRYRLLDLQFVPYRDAEGSLSFDKDVFEPNADEVIDDPRAIASNSDEDDDGIEDNEVEEENDGKNSIVPLFSERENGYSLVLDVILQESGNSSRRKFLSRYNALTKEKEYTEFYVYTNKGAIQRLTRNFEDGGVQRYVYYFSTGGLKEIFYQDPDQSSYLLSYTLEGDLQEKAIYNKEQKLSYELINIYDKRNNLEKQEERDFETELEIVSNYKNNQLIRRRVYLMSDDSVSKDGQENSVAQADGESQEAVDTRILLKTEQFEYNPSGSQIGKQDIDILHEDIESIEYEEDKKITTLKRDGVIVSQTVEDGDVKIVSLYFRGEEVMRIYYNRTKKVREEVVVEGEIIEIRTFQ